MFPIGGITQQVGIMIDGAEFCIQNVHRLYAALQVLAYIHKTSSFPAFHRYFYSAVIQHYLLNQYVKYTYRVILSQRIFKAVILNSMIILVKTLPKVLGNMFLHTAGIFTGKGDNV